MYKTMKISIIILNHLTKTLEKTKIEMNVATDFKEIISLEKNLQIFLSIVVF